MKLCGQAWKALSEEQKAPFNKKNEDDKKRYEAQLKDLEKKGYFIMSDGTKSSDHEAPDTKRKARADTKSPAKRKSAPTKVPAAKKAK